MKITDVRTYPVRVPLLYEFKAAYGTRNTADFVIVEIVTDIGLSGWGESSTIPIYDTGSQADVVLIIERYYKPMLLGKDPTDIMGILASLDNAVKSARYAKCAVDFALHDISGKHFGLPVYKMLGGGRTSLPICWVIGAKSANDIQSEAQEKLDAGFTTFKLKVGTHHDLDIENLAALREAAGPKISIRLDGNEAWNPKQALEILEKFSKYAPDHIEQPVPAWDVEGLRFVRERTPIPVVADECILSCRDTLRILMANAADRINIKVSRAGGIVESRKIAYVAHAAGRHPFAGSNLELGIGTVASAHLFATLPEAELTTELVGPLLLKEDIVAEPVKYENGNIVLSDAPGFGVWPCRKLLEKYACRRLKPE